MEDIWKLLNGCRAVKKLIGMMDTSVINKMSCIRYEFVFGFSIPSVFGFSILSVFGFSILSVFGFSIPSV